MTSQKKPRREGRGNPGAVAAPQGDDLNPTRPIGEGQAFHGAWRTALADCASGFRQKGFYDTAETPRHLRRRLEREAKKAVQKAKGGSDE